MQNRPVLVVRGSARVSRAGFGVAPKPSFSNATTSLSSNTGEKFAIERRAHQHTKQARYPIIVAALFMFAQICLNLFVSLYKSCETPKLW